MASENDVKFTASVKDDASAAIKKIADKNEELSSSADKASSSVEKLEASKSAMIKAFEQAAKANEEANQAQQEASKLAEQAAVATTNVEQAQQAAARAAERAAVATEKSEQANEKATRAAEKYTSAQQKMSGGADILSRSLERVKKGFALDVVIGNLITGGISAAISAVKALGKAVVDTVYEFSKGEMVTARLNASLRNQGITSKYVAEELDAYAKSMRAVSGVDDDVFKDGMRLLINFGLLGDELKRATNSAYNLSVGMGMDLNSAFQVVAKAAEGNVSMLSRYGVSVDASKSKSEQFSSALDQIDKKFGQLAGVNADNLITKTQVLKEEWQEFKENTLQGLEPLLSRLVSKANDFLESLSYMRNRTEEQKRYQELLEQEAKTRELIHKAEKVEKYGMNAGYLANLREKLAGIEAEKKAIEDANYKKLEQAKIEQVQAEEQTKNAQKRIAEEKKAADAREKEAQANQKAQEDRERRLNDFAVNARKERYDSITAIIMEASAAEQAELIANKEKEYETQLASLDARISLLDEGKADELERLVELNAEKQILREEFDAYNAEIDALQTENKIIATEEDIERARRAEELKIQFASDGWTTVKKGLTDLATFQNAKNKELAVVGKSAAVANAMMNTYQAANLALATVAPPWGYVQAAISTAMGLANVAQIAGVQFAVGTPYVPEDMPATVHRGEIIVPRTFSEGLRAGDLALASPDVLNGAEGGGQYNVVQNFNFNGDVLADSADSIAEKLGQKTSELIAGGRMAPFPTGERM